MIFCVDVDYQTGVATTAIVGFQDWPDACPSSEAVYRSHAEAAPYEPGQFYKRELPCILDALQRVRAPIETVVVDGYVWLGPERPGLGARLHAALGGGVAVVGVAKRSFHGATDAVPVTRGESQQPLLVTAVGMDAQAAAAHLRQMHGAFRLPTLLKHVDRLARGRAVPAPAPAPVAVAVAVHGEGEGTGGTP